MVDVWDLDGLIRRRSGCRCRTTMTMNWDDKRKAVVCVFVDFFDLLVFRLAILVLGSLGTINIVGVQLLVFLFLIFGHLLPELTFLCRQTLPLLADCLGKISLPLLLCRSIRRCNIFSLLAIFTTLPSEEDESIFWTLDVVFVSFFRPSLNEVATA